MQNIYQNERGRKKSPSLLTILGIAALFFFVAAEELSEDAIFLFTVLFVFAVPALILSALFKKNRKRRKNAEVHTHDRIDHRSDIQINPRTGKTTHTPLNRAAQHSAREHWQQQLDGLLANGTIDRAEYRALMDRKF